MQEEARLIIQQVINYNVNNLLDQIPIGSSPPPFNPSSVITPTKTMDKEHWNTGLPSPGDGYPGQEPDEVRTL